MANQQKPKKPPFDKFIRYSALGMQMLLTILVFAYLGQWLDGRYETQKPYFTVGLSLFGVMAAMVYFVNQIRKG